MQPLIPLTNGIVVDHEFHLTIGTLDEIRARFAKPAHSPRDKPQPDSDTP